MSWPWIWPFLVKTLFRFCIILTQLSSSQVLNSFSHTVHRDFKLKFLISNYRLYMRKQGSHLLESSLSDFISCHFDDKIFSNNILWIYCWVIFFIFKILECYISKRFFLFKWLNGLRRVKLRGVGWGNFRLGT